VDAKVGKICSAQVGSLADEPAVFEMLSREGPAAHPGLADRHARRV